MNALGALGLQPEPPLERQVADTVSGRAGAGKGETFRPRPGWPSMQQLDYVQKFSTAALLTLGLVMLVFHGITNPAGATRLLARGAKQQAGMA